MPFSRRILHDTSSSSSPPRSLGRQVPGSIAPLEQRDASTPSAFDREATNPAAKKARSAAEGRVEVIDISSDDSVRSSPTLGNQNQAVVLPVWNPLHFAAEFGHFPTPDDVPMVGIPAAQDAAVLDVNDGYLWNAVPASVRQYLDLEATCVSDTSSGSSDGSDGELSPGFIDDIEPEKENITVEDVKLLQRMFPKTYRCDCHVIHGRIGSAFDVLFRWMSRRGPLSP